nr:replication protein A 70 kDa DNA-binding subunit B [Tanacetum cinerariifolium]
MTQLCDIGPMLDDLKVLARCISIWKPHPANKPNEVWSLEMVFQDAQNNDESRNISCGLAISIGSGYKTVKKRRPLRTKHRRSNMEPNKDTVPNCGSKGAKPQGVLDGFDSSITNRTRKRIHINPVSRKIPPRWKTAAKGSLYKDVNLFGKKAIPSCLHAIIRKIYLINMFASGFNYEGRCPYSLRPIILQIIERVIC